MKKYILHKYFPSTIRWAFANITFCIRFKCSIQVSVVQWIIWCPGYLLWTWGLIMGRRCPLHASTWRECSIYLCCWCLHLYATPMLYINANDLHFLFSAIQPTNNKRVWFSRNLQMNNINSTSHAIMRIWTCAKEQQQRSAQLGG